MIYHSEHTLVPANLGRYTLHGAAQLKFMNFYWLSSAKAGIDRSLFTNMRYRPVSIYNYETVGIGINRMCIENVALNDCKLIKGLLCYSNSRAGFMINDVSRVKVCRKHSNKNRALIYCINITRKEQLILPLDSKRTLQIQD